MVARFQEEQPAAETLRSTTAAAGELYFSFVVPEAHALACVALALLAARAAVALLLQALIFRKQRVRSLARATQLATPPAQKKAD